jgi:hypothetical protein
VGHAGADGAAVGLLLWRSALRAAGGVLGAWAGGGREWGSQRRPVFACEPVMQAATLSGPRRTPTWLPAASTCSVVPAVNHTGGGGAAAEQLRGSCRGAGDGPCGGLGRCVAHAAARLPPGPRHCRRWT